MGTSHLSSQTLTTLNLGKNKIDLDGIYHLTIALQINTVSRTFTFHRSSRSIA